MPNSNKNINEVIVNGETLLSTRENTVTEDTLAEGETAQDKSGKKIIGNMQGGSNSNPYFVTDSLSSNLSEDDYIPYYDVSEQKKHNTLLSKFVDFLKGIFITGSNSDADIYLTGQSFALKMHDIDASKPDNNIDAIKYPSTSNILDNEDRIITRFDSKVNPNGNIGAKFYVRNYDEEGNAVGQKGISFDMDKSGNLTYTIDEPNKFRQSINTVDQQGIAIPDNANLDSYKTAGTYKIISDASAQTMTNIPTNVCGKLVVFDNNNGGYEQFYFSNHSPRIYLRTWWSNAWSSWAELTGNAKPHTYEGGTQIPANSDLNNYKTEGVYNTVSNVNTATLLNCPTDVAGQLIISKILPSGNYQIQYYIDFFGNIYVRRYDNYLSFWSDWSKLSKGAHTYEDGTQIPADSDLNNYKTEGVYFVSSFNDASTILNLPITGAGKLLVLSRDTYIRCFQIYIGGASDIYIREMDNNNVWGDWVHLASTDDILAASFNSGYAVATKNGSAITATINGFVLKAGVIVSLKMQSSAIEADSTLNINGTGAKSIKFWGNNPISYGLSLGADITATLIYDGTYYRIISLDRTPYVAIQNYTADTSGNILLDWGYDVNRAQIKYGISNNKLAWNYYKNSAWRGDVTIADYNDLSRYLPLTGGTLTGYLNLKSSRRMIAGGAYNPTSNTTIDALIDELRFSNGAYGSFELETAYTYLYTTIPTGWYNYFYIPHRVGGENWQTPTSWGADNVLHGTLLLYGMNNTNGMFRIRIDSRDNIATIVEVENLQKGNCYVGTCTTAANERTKVVTVDDNFVLRKGVRVAVKFTNSNTYENVTANPITLNVNGTGAKNIWAWSTHSGAGNTGTQQSYYGYANRYIYYVYDGTYWVWDGASGDNNSTNFLRNDVQSPVVTYNGAIIFDLKSTNIDSKQSNNGVTSAQFPAYIIQDKNNEVIARFESVVDTNGNISTYLYSRNYNTSTSAYFFGGIKILTDKSGNLWYYISNPHKFLNSVGTGFGTCTTAADARVKVVTIYNFVLTVGGIIGVKFTNTNTYSATADNKICLNVNGTGEKPIYYSNGYTAGTETRIYGIANRTFFYMYDGTNWVWLSSGYEYDTTYSNMSLSEFKTGTATNQRTLQATVLNQAMETYASAYGTCTTAAGERAKVVTVTDSNWKLRVGAIVGVKFTNTNTYSSTAGNKICLNVNGTGEKPIYYNTGYPTGTFNWAFGVANRTQFYMYDGTNWCFISMGVEVDTTYSPATLGFGYGTCSTAEATTAKVATLSGYNLITNGYVTIKFTYAVPANSTLNINSKGAKEIWYRGVKITANIIKANDLATFIYDGTRYHLVGIDRHCRSTDISSSVTVGCASFSTGDTYVKREGDKCVVNFERFLTADYTLQGYNTNILSGLPTIKNATFWKTAIPMFVAKNGIVTNVIPVQCHRNPTVLQTEGVNITIPSGSRISFSFEYYCNP